MYLVRERQRPDKRKRGRTAVVRPMKGSRIPYPHKDAGLGITCGPTRFTIRDFVPDLDDLAYEVRNTSYLLFERTDLERTNYFGQRERNRRRYVQLPVWVSSGYAVVPFF